MPPIEAPRKFSQPFYLSSDQNNNSENIINCEYYHIDEIQTLNKLNNKNTFLYKLLFSFKKY